MERLRKDREEIDDRTWIKVSEADFLLTKNEARTRLCVAQWTTADSERPADNILIWMEMPPTGPSLDQYESRRRVAYADCFSQRGHVNWPYGVEWTEGNVAEWTITDLRRRFSDQSIDADFYIEVYEEY